MLYDKYADLQNELSNIPFGNIDVDTFSCETIEDLFDYGGWSIPTEWDWAYGVSKLVLIPNNHDYVVKIPFSAVFVEYNEDENDPEVYAPLEGARLCLSGVCSWNYCEAEAQFFHAAQEKNLDYFFAPTKYIGDLAGWPIYIQEKCYTEEDSKIRHSDADINRTKDWLSSSGQGKNRSISKMSSNFMTDLLLQNGGEEVTRLFDFLEDEGIYDLHTGNCGYDMRGNALFVDYSSFDD